MTDYVVPESFGGLCDRIYELQQERRRINREAAAIGDEEKFLKQRFLDTLPKGDGGAVGQKARITVLKDVSYSISNDAEFYEYVKNAGAWDLLPRSINKNAVESRQDAGVEVPGIEAFIFSKLSINKI